jgi:DNA-binding GntR family transcriptional regulator
VHTELYTPLRGDHAYTELKQRVLAGDFRLGSRLKEVRLAGLLGVSRTPIREALLRLHAEGLLDRHPDGGFQPQVPDVTAIGWLYEVRSALELHAIRRPRGGDDAHDRDAVAALVRDWATLAADAPEPSPQFVLVDESFHLGLADAAGNPLLVDQLRQVNERIRTVRMLDFLTEDRVALTIAEHLDIAQAVLDDDLDAAEQHFLSHLDHSQSVVEQRVAAAIARMASAPEMEDAT